ncbi:MAG: alkaline phosphatase family protein [Acidobacteria bacterium]|nr:alkaline phosphatase family protein [Acidobacteriota bacterium]
MRIRSVLSLCVAAVLLVASARAVPQSTVSSPDASTVTILIGLDGWRWDYVSRHRPPTLSALAARGVQASGLIPVFPSLTFPNHYSIVTGLRPASHGIVSNVMRDPAIAGQFRLADTAVTHIPAWWKGEPVWHTVTRQGRQAASMFWPGSDIAISGRYPTRYRTFDHNLPPADRTAQVLEWLALPSDARPSFITVYYSDLDTDGHAYGPDAPEIAASVARVDREIGRLVEGATTLGLADRVHWVVVSDHGMIGLSADRLIVIDDYVDLSTVDLGEVGPLLTLSGTAVSNDAVYAALADRHPHLKVWRSADLPARFGLAGHPRLPGVIGLADEGWTVTTRARAASARAEGSRPAWGGAHGFDPALRDMQGVLIAAGPRLRPGLRPPAVENVHLYELLCALVGVTPARNDGDASVTRPWLR